MSTMPSTVQKYADLAHYLQRKSHEAPLSADERDKLLRARLEVAKWALIDEGLEVTRDNLTQILGPDAFDAIALMESPSRFAKADVGRSPTPPSQSAPASPPPTGD